MVTTKVILNPPCCQRQDNCDTSTLFNACLATFTPNTSIHIQHTFPIAKSDTQCFFTTMNLMTMYDNLSHLKFNPKIE